MLNMPKTLLQKVGRVNRNIIIVIVALVAFRAILPEAIRYGLNWFLGNKLESYYGHIEDFDLSLYRGAYQIQGLTFRKKSLPEKSAPLLSLADSDISISWKALFKERKLLLDLSLIELKVSLLDDPKENKQQFGNEEKTSNWKDVLEALIPFSINNAELTRSSIFFQNFSQEPLVNLYIKNINLSVSDFSNMSDSKEMNTHIKGSANVMEDAELNLDSKYNYRSKTLNLDGKIELTKLNLTQLNPFLEHYAGIDLEKGNLRAFSEVTIKDNKMNMYVKPFIEDVDLINFPEDLKKPKKFLIELLAAMSAWLTKSGKTDKTAFVIPIQGATDNPQVKIWTTIKTGLINGFIRPLEEKFED